MRYAYQTDAYRTALPATVTGIEGTAIRLSDTVFHPRGGGQPGDSGTLEGARGEARVVDTEETPEGILHRLDRSIDGLEVGDAVTGRIDWTRRYRFMRYHTALHLLSGVVYRRFGSGITGNQIAEDGARMDFSIPEFARPLAEELIAATNEIAAKALTVEVRFISAEERAARPELVRVATDRADARDEARLIDIGGFDVQADGGTHVRSTAELGPLRLDRIENKGARNKRLYVRLEERPAPADL